MPAGGISVPIREGTRVPMGAEQNAVRAVRTEPAHVIAHQHRVIEARRPAAKLLFDECVGEDAQLHAQPVTALFMTARPRHAWTKLGLFNQVAKCPVGIEGRHRFGAAEQCNES